MAVPDVEAHALPATERAHPRRATGTLLTTNRKAIVKAKTALIAAALLVAATARAEFLSGNDLLRDMQGSHGQQMAALGYVQGVHDATTGASIHCAPGALTAGQLNDMVKIWLRENPAERHRSGDVIVLYVLKTTFPCAKRQGTPGV